MEKTELLALLESARVGDRRAQEKLIIQIQNPVYYQCKKMLKNEEEAQDATQDILISVLTSLDKLRQPEAFYGWVNGITANRCKHLLTRGAKEWQIPEDEEGNSLLDDLEDLDDQAVPDKAIDNEETRRMIAQLVDDLPEAQRMTVLLYYYDEMSVREIAAAMETTEGTVKSRLNYARKSIKEGVEDYERQGLKLYGVSPLPLLLYFLCKDAAAHVLSREAALRITASAVEAAGAAGTVAGATTAAGAAGTATGTAGAAAVTSRAAGVAGTATATATKAGVGLGVKIAAALTAMAVVGGGAAVVTHREGATTPSVPPVEVTAALPTAEVLVEIPVVESTPTPNPTIPPEERYMTYSQILEELDAAYPEDDWNNRINWIFFGDWDRDGAEELIALTQEDINWLSATVYDVDEGGEPITLRLNEENQYPNAGNGWLDLGISTYNREPCAVMRYSNSWAEGSSEEYTVLYPQGDTVNRGGVFSFTKSDMDGKVVLTDSPAEVESPGDAWLLLEELRENFVSLSEQAFGGSEGKWDALWVRGKNLTSCLSQCQERAQGQ